MKRIIGTLLLSLVLGASLAQNETIDLGYVLWDSEIASTHVVAAILQDELGYDVELTSVDAGPMWTGVAQGDFDAIVAAWLPGTHEAYWDEYGDQLVDLGPNLDGADLGWAVPSYVELESIGDLRGNADMFDGEIIGIDPGAGLMAASEEAMDVYELNDEYNLLDGSDAAMTAALDRAIGNNEPIVVTSWRPHWMWAAYDIKYLEDPEGALGEAESIHTILSQDFADNGPQEAIDFLDNFYWTSEQMGAVMLDITQEGMEPMEAARAWIEENQDVVSEWLP